MLPTLPPIPADAIFFNPKGDRTMAKRLKDTIARGNLYFSECERRHVKFLPKQVMRPVLQRAGLADGPMLKSSPMDLIVLNLNTVKPLRLATRRGISRQ